MENSVLHLWLRPPLLEQASELWAVVACLSYVVRPQSPEQGDLEHARSEKFSGLTLHVKKMQCHGI